MYLYTDPIIVSLGPLAIRYYGLVYAIGFILLYSALQKNAHTLHLSKERALDSLFYIAIGLIIGGRIVHFLFADPAIFIQNPLELFYIWHGGMAFFGAALGAAIGAYIFTIRAYKKQGIKEQMLRFFQLADIVVLPAAFTLILGRIANFINQELVGTVTSVPWCVHFITNMYAYSMQHAQPIFDTLCRHPYQLYAAGAHLILFVLLFIIVKYQKKNKEQVPGILLSLFLIGYGIVRFVTDFFRDEGTTWLFGITEWQYFSVLFILGGVLLYIYQQKKKVNIHGSQKNKHKKRR